MAISSRPVSNRPPSAAQPRRAIAVRDARPPNDGGPITGASYAYMQGTSMATPQVTGAAAVVASKLGLRGSALRSRLLSTADDRGNAGYDTKFGNGRLNVHRAVTGLTLASPH